MEQATVICTNCFQKRKSPHKCEHCGWEEAPQPSFAIPYRTVIHGQYTVGRLLQATSEALSYIAYDTKLSRLVLLVEFFPKDASARAADKLTVKPLDEALFEGRKAEFVHLGRTRLWIEEPNIQRLANYFEENNTAYWILSWHSGQRLVDVYPKALTEADAIEKVYPIFVALKILHERGLVLESELVDVALEDEFGSEVLMTIGGFADEAHKRHDVRQAGGLLLQLLTGRKLPYKKKDEIDQVLAKLKLSDGVKKALQQALSPESYPQMHNFIEALTGQKQVAKKELIQTKPQYQQIAGYSKMPIEVMPTATTLLYEEEIPEEYLLPKPPKKTDYRSIALATLGGIGLVAALSVWIWLSLAPKRLVVKADGSGKYKTIEAAIKEAGQDATVYVEPGVYKENLVIAKPIKLVGNNEDGEVIIQGTQKPAITAFAPIGEVKGFTLKTVGDKKDVIPALLVVDGGVTFTDIKVESKLGAGLRVTGANTNPTFKGIVAKNSAMEGVLFDAGAKGMVEDANISGNGGFGVHLLDGANPIFRYGKISYNYLGGVLIEAAGGTFAELSISNHNKPNVNIAFGGNPYFKSVDIFESKENGVYILAEGKGVFEACNIYKNLFANINVLRMGSPIIKNSKIYDGKDVGIWFHDSAQGYVENIEVYQNVKANVRISTAANPTIKTSLIRDGYGYGLFFDDKGKGNISQVKVYGNKLAGININTGANPTIKNSEIYNGLQVGVLVIDKGLGRLMQNKIYSNTFQNVHVSYEANPSFYQNEIFNGQSSGVWVEENGKGKFTSDSIYNNKKSGIGIRTGGNPTFSKVSVMRNDSHGAWVAYSGNGIFKQNIFSSNNGFAIYAEADTNPDLGENRYEQNRSGNIKDLRTKVPKDSVATLLEKP